MYLVKFDQAKQALAEASSVDEVLDIKDKMEALKMYLRQHGESREMQNQCALISIRAQQKAADIVDKMQENGELNKNGKPSHGERVLKDFDINYSALHRWRKIQIIPDEVLQQYVAMVNEAGEELTTAGLLRFNDGKARDIERIQSKSVNEWFTPEKYIRAVHQVLGQVDVDPASNPIANKIVKAKIFYTKDDNGLKYDWPGKVFLNPPYGGLTKKFASQLVRQFQNNITTEAILLVNANSTDTNWFAPMFDYIICFTNHRIDFISSESKAGGSTHGSAFVYFGNNIEKFINHFKKFGPIVKRIDV